MKKSRNILVFGDIFPNDDFLTCYEQFGVEAIFTNLIDVIQDSNYVIGNLECCVTIGKKSAPKDGSHLKARPDVLKAFSEVGFNGFNLANNHSMDCGTDGLIDTMNHLEHNNLAHFGTRQNIRAPKSVSYLMQDGLKIAVLSLAEKEFNAPTTTRIGVNLQDPLEDLELINTVKSEADYIVILYHGGLEYYPYPTPRLQKRCRSYITSGADIVLCQHSHVIGASEYYKKGFILYGQGNSIMPKVQRNHDGWNNGLLVGISFTNGFEIELIPVKQDLNASKISKASDKDSREILEYQKSISELIKSNSFIEKNFNRVIFEKSKLYESRLAANGKVVRRIKQLLPFRYQSPLKNYLTQRNLIECVTHREIIEALWLKSK